MSQYSWATCPDPVRAQINSLIVTLQNILSDLVGVYLHGSLAMGCFNPQRSDIDLLVVTRNGMAVETKRDVVEYLLAFSQSPSPIEISFLVQKDIHLSVYFALNACRVLAYLREEHIFSKDEGGMWGLRTLPPELHGVVEQALETYRGNLMGAPFDETALTQFAHYMDTLFLRL